MTNCVADLKRRWTTYVAWASFPECWTTKLENSLFAYGSNMASDRLQLRAPFIRIHGCAKVPDKRMICNKKSDDGSAKANLVDEPGNEVWGVLYEIDSSDFAKLDRAEIGYKRITLKV